MLADRILAAVILLLAMICSWYSWQILPHPSEGGNYVMLAAGGVATSLTFTKTAAGRPVWPRALTLVGIVLGVQALMQASVAMGYLS